MPKSNGKTNYSRIRFLLPQQALVQVRREQEKQLARRAAAMRREMAVEVSTAGGGGQAAVAIVHSIASETGSRGSHPGSVAGGSSVGGGGSNLGGAEEGGEVGGGDTGGGRGIFDVSEIMYRELVVAEVWECFWETGLTFRAFVWL